jgi:hypothetical protein
VIVLKFFNHLVPFCEIHWGRHGIEGDLEAILVNPVASTIPKWLKQKFLQWLQN